MSPVGLIEIQQDVTALDMDLHTATYNFAPNEYRGVVNPFGLAVYKGSKHKGRKVIVAATESKSKK